MPARTGIKQSEATRRKKSLQMAKKWQEPEYRKMMIEKQKKIGLR